MTGPESISAIAGLTESSTVALSLGQTELLTGPKPNFYNLLADGLQNVELRVEAADQLTKKFIADPHSVSVHEVIMSLEKAKLSVDLAMQIRNRAVEGYRDIMNMQL